jgi:hypothetical protein
VQIDPPKLIACFLLAGPALYALYLAFGDMPRSRRLANLSLACGLAILVVPEKALGLSPVEWPGVYRGVGVAHMALGLTGVALAIAAFLMRKDGGVGVARPLLGGLISIVHIVIGYGGLLFSSLNGPSTPWVYQSPDGSYRITLPGEQWRESPIPPDKGLAAFVRPAPRMQAVVRSVQREQTDADFALAIKALKYNLEHGSTELPKNVKFQDGVNAAGNSYRYGFGMDSSPDGKPVFVGVSATWIASKKIVVGIIFEAQPFHISETGKELEMDAIKKSAETICLSAE